MFNVRIFIETTWRGPAQRKGMAMWLVEYKTQGSGGAGKDIPVTREGILSLEDATETKAVLLAVTAALRVLKKSCFVSVFTKCGQILGAVQNRWYERWQKDGWVTAKGDPVKNDVEWREMLEAMNGHIVGFTTDPHEYRSYMQAGMRRKELEEKCQKA